MSRLKEFAHARFGDDFAVAHQYVATADANYRVALQLPAFEGCVIGLTVQHIHRQRDIFIGVDDGDIRIGTQRQHALRAVKTGQPGWVGRDYIHKAGERETAFAHAFGEDQGQAGLDTGCTVRDLLEGLAGCFEQADFVFIGESAVIRADGDQGVIAQVGPQYFLVFLGSQGRGDDVLHALVPWALVFAVIQQQEVRHGFAVDLGALGARFGNFLHCASGGHVHHQNRYTRLTGNLANTMRGFHFGAHRAGRRMPFHTGFAFGNSLVAQIIDGAGVFGSGC